MTEPTFSTTGRRPVRVPRKVRIVSVQKPGVTIYRVKMGEKGKGENIYEVEAPLENRPDGDYEAMRECQIFADNHGYIVVNKPRLRRVRKAEETL